MRKLFTLILFMIPLACFAPAEKKFYLTHPNAIDPYLKIRNAIASFESQGDSLAFNPIENAVGLYQVRPIRLLDYNIRTGKKYSQNDCFRPKIANEIITYYCEMYGPYKTDRFIRSWNGSGKATVQYLKQIKNIINGN